VSASSTAACLRCAPRSEGRTGKASVLVKMLGLYHLGGAPSPPPQWLHRLSLPQTWAVPRFMGCHMLLVHSNESLCL
jgi:hypothetical protein